MKILQFNGPWQFSVEESAEPAVGPGELLIRSDAVGICGSDVHGFTGESGRRKPGMVMGHEVVGTVVGVGPGVSTPKMGSRVAIFPIRGCGRCRYCAAGMEHICPEKRILGVNAGKWGAMADRFTCHERQAFVMDAELDPAVGLLAEPIGVALHAVRLMKASKDAILVIVGAGTIGLAVTLVLREFGHRSVFVIDRIGEKLDVARELGATALHADEEPGAALAKLTGGRRADGVFEAVGMAETVRTAFELCDFGGTLVLIGNLAKEFTLPLQSVTANETTIRGSYGFTSSEFGEAVQIVSRHPDSMRRFITGHCSLEQTAGVMTRMARGEIQATKMVICPQRHD